MLKKASNIINALSGVKMITYQLVILFTLSFIVPGTLIMFYFYRDIFVSYDLTKLFLIIIAVSTIFVMASKGAIDIIGTKYSKYLSEKENEQFESALTYIALRLALLGCGISLFVCYLLGSHSKTFFVIIYLAVILLFYLLIWISFCNESDKVTEDKESEVEGKQNDSVNKG